MDIKHFHQQRVRAEFLGGWGTNRSIMRSGLFSRIVPCLIVITGALFLFFLALPSAHASGRGYSAILTCTPITFGSTLSDAIDSPGKQDCFSVSGEAGDRIRVSVVQTSGTLTPMRAILNPNGTVLCSAVTNPLDCTLTTTGSHTVLVYDFNGTGIGSYKIHVQRLNNPVGCVVATFGSSPLSGSITNAAEQDCSTFSGEAGDRIRLSVVQTSGTLTPMRAILNPNGTVLCVAITNPLDCTLTTTGSHTVLVYDFGGTGIGNYNTYIQRLNNPVGCVSISFDSSVMTGTIFQPAQENCYTFYGELGDQIRVSAPVTSGIWTSFREIINPDGTSLCGSVVNPTDCSLNVDGVHAVLIYDFSGANTGGYDISLSCLSSPCAGQSTVQKQFNSLAGQDGWILESTETSGVGGRLNKTATTLRLGDDANNRQYRSILSFDTGFLPDEGTVITSVTLRIKHAGVSGTNPFRTHGKLLADICMGGYNNKFTLELVDFKVRCSRNKALIYSNSKVDNWYAQSLLPEDFQFINLVGVTQFRLRFTRDDNNDFGADFLKIFSGNAAEANRPQLVIEYYIP